ncbi:hypothetical protein AMS68_005847 [Peltaster fructicola]|uniref:aldehyde dehydrogenase (NAD(+)) n=1 Tax=Peltaster fructicola TaxID=286661 RepID=A0A6H0Y106_9PEZI|nr:hypothetical protein AMS68_005847 [Peltaster fructicola]
MPTDIIVNVQHLLPAFLLGGIVLWIFRSRLNSAREQGIAYTLAAPTTEKVHVLTNPTIKVPGSPDIQCYSPATGELLQCITPVTPDGLDRLIDQAGTAQKEWAETQFWQRRRVLKTILRFILDNQDEIVRVACLDSGKTRVDALFGEILVTVEKLKWTIDHGETALRPERRPTNFLMFYKKNVVHYEPLGVIAACVSWNYPFHNILGPIISALFTGNAIVVKGSEQTAWSSQYFGDLVRKALVVTGHNADIVHVVSCWPETAEHLTSHPKISHLLFIGSKPVAHAVAKSASRALIPLCVELGGKDAAVILDHDGNTLPSQGEIDRIASIIMRGVFQSAGQNCIGIERIVAMPRMYEKLVTMLTPRIKALRLGNDLDVREGGQVDVGASISSASFDRLEKLIAEAVSQGASLIVGGRKVKHPKYPQGHYFAPTLLVNVTPDMRIAREELFAPICVFMKAETVQQAVDITNGTMYGLGCSVFGPTHTTAARDSLQHVAKQIKSGMVAINDFAVYYAVQLPFGGVAGSGYGRFAGEEGLRSICNVKSVCSDRFPSIIKTAIPGKLDYPMQAGAFNMATGIVEFGYGDSFYRMWIGIRKLVGA